MGSPPHVHLDVPKSVAQLLRQIPVFATDICRNGLVHIFYVDIRFDMQVKQKLTSTVRFNFSTAIESVFQQHYSECFKDGRVRQSKAQKFLEGAPIA